jgi:phosphoglycerate dehydrogenase-like enzyme
MNAQVLIATPLEAELVERVRAAVPEVRVSYEPDLLPPARFPCDHVGEPGFRRTPDQQKRFESLLGGADVLFGMPDGTPETLAQVVRAHPRLRWVAGTAAGAGEVVRRAELTPAELDRVRFTAARGVHARQLAEWSMLGLLAFTKGLPRLLADKQARHWVHYPVRELAEQTLLVIGLGAIGREVARQAGGLGMRVIGVRRSGASTALVDESRTIDELPGLVSQVDAVVLALPDTVATRGVFDRAMIEALPAHAIVVNVGRGATLDEDALIEALEERRIAGAALDVFATEPLPDDHPFWSMDNVLLSPHTAALSVRENERIIDQFIANLPRYLDGRPLNDLVDVAEFY